MKPARRCCRIWREMILDRKTNRPSLSFSAQHHHSMGEGPWERCLWAHHHAVSQRARVHSQRQLWHLQCLREDLGRRPAESDREAQPGRSVGRSTGLRKPTRYSSEGELVWPSCLLTSIPPPSLFTNVLFPFSACVRFWRSWVRSSPQRRTPKVLRFSLLTSESSKETELTSTHCKR